MITTPQRATEISGQIIAKSKQCSQVAAIVLGEDVALEISAILDAYARMMGAALTDAVAEIARLAALPMMPPGEEPNREELIGYVATLRDHIATLLAAVRVLTAERDGHESDSAQRWQRIIATEKERDTARAELNGLQGVHAFMRKCFESEREAMMGKVFTLRAKVVELGGTVHEYAMGATTNEERLAVELVAARAEVEKLRESNRQLTEVAELVNGSLTKRTQELSAAEEALRVERGRAAFWIKERNRSEKLYLTTSERDAATAKVIEVVRMMRARKAEMDNDPTLADVLRQNTILYPFVELLNSLELPE